jgi:hypothetical protein
MRNARRGFQYKIRWSRWKTVMPGMRTRTADHEDGTLRLVEYTRRMWPHWCVKGHLGCVLAGRMRIRYAQRSLILRPGDPFIIPAGRRFRHMGIPLTPKVSVLMVE